MKYLFHLLLILTFFASCKPTSSVITSKKEAQKRGIYKTPENKKTASASNKKKTVPDEKELKKQIKNAKKKSRKEKRNNDAHIADAEKTSYLVEQLINSASDNLGANYRSGGTTKKGFDCSGLMYATFKNFDITLPRSSNDMAKMGTKLNNDEIRKGDLIFFKTNGKSVINHVGMVIEVSEDEIKFIHSSTSSGVIISSTKEGYYGENFVQANRIL